MRLVSFDVGIKNLAYCVFSIDSKSNAWSIPEWNCANLLLSGSQEVESKTCCQMIKAKKKKDPDYLCGKPAKWVSPTEHSYCESHAKMNMQWIRPTSKHTSSHINKLKKDGLELEYNKLFLDSSANVATREKMKKSDYIEKILAYYDSKCYRSTTVQTVKSKTAGEVDLVTIGRAIRRQLDNDPSITDITHVIIENQISTIASRMKTIQGMIAQYFIMRFGDGVSVEFVSSHNKLKGYNLEEGRGDTLNENSDKKASYKANKSDGIIICRRFFESNRELSCWRSEFDKSKKRDDLADCFLQGIWYLKTNKIIYIAEDLKINSVFVS